MIVAYVALRPLQLQKLAQDAELPAAVFVPLWWIQLLLDDLDAPNWLANSVGEFIAELHASFHDHDM